MYNVPQEIIQAFQDNTIIIAALLDGCTQEQAQTSRDGPDGWSVLEVVCHLRDGEERALERMRLMRDKDEPVIVPFDQDQWVYERNYAAEDLRQAFADFLRWRELYVTELQILPPDAWQRAGHHEEQGRITISSHAFHRVCHDISHAAQLARQLGRVTLTRELGYE
jgi:hypothetical protein